MRFKAGASLLGLIVALAIAPTAVAERTVVVTNGGSGFSAGNTIASYRIGSDGRLVTRAGSPIPTGDGPTGVAFTPDARFAYTVNVMDDNVSAYAIAADGSLNELAGSPFASGGDGPSGIAITPNGRFLITSNRIVGANNVSVLAIAADGSLVPVTGSPFGLGMGLIDPRGIAVSPNGQRVYVTAQPGMMSSASRVVAYSINSSGALALLPGSPFSTSGTNGAFALGLTPDGGRLFVGNANSNDISVLDINQATGALAPVAGSPFATANAPIGLQVDSSGDRLVVGHSGTGEQVRTFAIGANGALSLEDTFVVGEDTMQPAVTPDGSRAYASVDADPGQALGLSIAPAGGLSALPGSPYPTGGTFPSFVSAASTPSQTPQPAFASAPAPPGEPTGFDASASDARGGEITRYDWSFGDGTSAADAGPSPTHAYADPGTYTARLTVTNDCPASAPRVDGRVFTGLTALCNGPATASLEAQVTIAGESCEGEPATIYAEAGATTEGTGGADVIVGTEGVDRIRSRGGADLVCTVDGDDDVRSGSGRDEVRTGDGRDQARGGKGRDLIRTEKGRDDLRGGRGRDDLRGGRGADSLDGGDGRDKLKGGKGRDRCVDGPLLRKCETGAGRG